jgi:hypothetical protein
VDNNTYATTGSLSGYLPLSGGTLTGALNGTSAAFSGNVSGANGSFTGSGRVLGIRKSSAFTGNLYQGFQNSSGSEIAFIGYGSTSNDKFSIVNVLDQIYIPSNRLIVNTTTDNGTDALQVSGSGLFSGNVTITNSGRPYFIANTTAPGEEAGIKIQQSTVSDWYIGTSQGSASAQDLAIRDVKNGRIPFYLSASTGAATFSSSVTATGFIVSSDKRLKDIVSRSGDMITYKWKDKKDNRLHYGYVAQEVEKDNPDQVHTDDKGIKSVNYIEILVKKVNDLEKELKELKSKIK